MGLDPARRPARGQAPGRLPARRGRLLRRTDRSPEPALHGPPQRAHGRSEAEAAIDEVLEQVGLTDRADDRVETYSRGHAPAARHRRRAGQVARPPDPRRADDVDRPARRRRDPRPPALARPRSRAGDPALEPPADPGPVGLRPDRDLRRRPPGRGGDRRRARQPVRRWRGDDRGRPRAADAPTIGRGPRRSLARSRTGSSRPCTRRTRRSDAWRLHRPAGRPRSRASVRPSSWPPSSTASASPRCDRSCRRSTTSTERPCSGAASPTRQSGAARRVPAGGPRHERRRSPRRRRRRPRPIEQPALRKLPAGWRVIAAKEFGDHLAQRPLHRRCCSSLAWRRRSRSTSPPT